MIGDGDGYDGGGTMGVGDGCDRRAIARFCNGEEIGQG
jgi:hypothetical protein